MQHALLEHANPHLGIGRRLHQQVLLAGKQPDQIVSPEDIASVIDEISYRAAHHEIEFQLIVGVRAVGRSCSVFPHRSEFPTQTVEDVLHVGTLGTK